MKWILKKLWTKAENKESNQIIEGLKKEITAMTEQLEKAKIELNKLSLILREISNAVIIADANGTIEWVNPAFIRVFGYKLHEYIEEKGANIIDAISSPNIKEAIKKCIDYKKSIVYDVQTITKSGKRVYVQTTLTPVTDKNGDIIKLIAIYSDITELKEAEEIIRAQTEEIKAQRDEIETQRNLAIEQKNKIALQNQQITSSITYAQKIQNALLSSDLLNDLPFEYFIIYRPKDIISGDFYWFAKKEDRYFIAAADCTGHGVPGAFMSVLGISLLNEIFNKNPDSKPNEILNILRENLIKSLHQTGKLGEAKDGMDIVLVSLTHSSDTPPYPLLLEGGQVSSRLYREDKGVCKETHYTLQFAGANNPLWLVRKQQYAVAVGSETPELPTAAANCQLTEIKADKMPIGIHHISNMQFTNHKVELMKGDTIYLFSDGYADQLGGPQIKKFKSIQFKELLLKIHHLPMQEQKNILNTTIDTWRGDIEQTDDILIIGIKI